MAGVINVFKGKYAFLSNFYNCPVEYEGLMYGSAEAAFQAAKLKANTQEETNHLRVMEGFTQANPSIAKRLGRHVKLRPDWEKVKDKVMLDIVRSKFNINKGLAQLLIETGDAMLIEGTTGWHDNYWGNCECPRCINKVGRNQLGKTLMQVRSEVV